MPQSAKRAKAATSAQLTKRAKLGAKKGPATVTRVPKWARALTDVVAAFEACDREALRRALDAADPALLNHIPALPEGMSLDHPDAAKWYRENCFFNACTEFRLGKRPLSLVSSAVCMLADAWSQKRPQHVLSRKTGLHRDEWIWVFNALITHEKVDLNARNPLGSVTYVVGMRDVWNNGQTDPQWRVREPPPEPVSEVGYFQHHALNGGGLANALVDDGMRAWDYACLIRDQQRLSENGGYARNLVSVMVESGKLAFTGADVVDLMLLALPNRAWLDNNHMIMNLNSSLFMSALPQVELGPMRTLFFTVETSGWQSPLRPTWWNQAIWYMRLHMREHWKVLCRKQLLGCVRWIARAHILLARWSADARLTSYAPGGAGFERAQRSFAEAATVGAAAAGGDGP